MEANKEFAIKLGQELQYIKIRKELGLAAYEMIKSITSEDFIILAEAYIELYNSQSINKSLDMEKK